MLNVEEKCARFPANRFKDVTALITSAGSAASSAHAFGEQPSPTRIYDI